MASTPGLTKGDLADIQGVIVRGYNMAAMRHFVVTIGNVGAARRFIGDLVSGDGPLSVTSSAEWPAGTKPDYALNIGFSAAGIEALCLPKSVSFGSVPYGNFASFLQGAVGRAEAVGDLGPSAPDTWVPKLSTPQAPDAHIILSLYATTPEIREERSATLASMFADVLPADGPAASVFSQDVDAMLITLPDGRVQHKIHFGYTDGISNPIVELEDSPALRPGQLPYVEPWRFVMRADAPQYKAPQPAAFGLNGSFSAFRILEQDVEGFDEFLQDQGRTPSEQEYLASKLCGRWRNGNPVVEAPDEPGEVLSYAELRDFDYGTDDVGQPCPYSSHTRRTNPRGGPAVQGVAGGEKVANRIMRRANPYGAPWQGSPDEVERGLAGHFICASLFNQFEFIMGQWVNQGSFGPNPAGRDPLLSSEVADPTTEFPYYKDDEPVSVPNMGQFVTTRGGLYCFLPSLTSLTWISEQAIHDAGDRFTVPTS